MGLADDALNVRGQGLVQGRVRSIGAAKVRWEDESGAHEAPTWMISAFELASTPPALRDGLEALSEGRFADATQAFTALSATPAAGTPDGDEEAAMRAGWLRAWGRFHAANALRVQADVAGRGHAEAATAFDEYLTAHADDVMAAPALLGQALAWLGAGERDRATATLAKLDDERFGPVWRLHAAVARARVDLEAGKHREALTALNEIAARAAGTEHAGEARQMAQAWAVEAQRRTGDPKGAIDAAPRTKNEAGQDILAVLTEDWLESPAAPVLLNALGQAVRDVMPGNDGAAASVTFHLRVARYFPTFHGEHSRALAQAAACFETVGQQEWATNLRDELRARYPDVQAASTPARRPGGGLGD